MNTTGYFHNIPEARPRILAHRGLIFAGEKQVADENTLQSFERALAAGADYLESDIQVTKDGVAVLFHDNDLKRLLGSKILISNLSFSQLESLKLPFGGKIPTLFEALTTFPEAKFNLDIKTSAAESVGMEVIADLYAFDRVLVSSFSESSRVRALAKATSPVATSAGSSKILKSYLAALFSSESILEKQLATVDAVQIPTKRYGIDFTNPRFVERVLAQGVEIHYWTINDPKEMIALYNLGAHGIVTDRADLAVKTFS